MTWTRSQPARAHRAPISPPSSSGYSCVQVLWSGNLLSYKRKAAQCPRPHTRLCTHSNLRACEPHTKHQTSRAIHRTEQRAVCSQGEQDLGTPWRTVPEAQDLQIFKHMCWKRKRDSLSSTHSLLTISPLLSLQKLLPADPLKDRCTSWQSFRCCKKRCKDTSVASVGQQCMHW